MELRHLRYFIAAAAAQNFTKAAATVHVSQPSLSVQIRALEDELGARLFDRLGRKVSLTQAGELFRDHAERAVRELERATQLVQEVHGAQRGRLVVGTLATVNSYLIPPVVSQFKQRFPQVHLQIHSQPSNDIVSSVLANRLDLGICLLPLVDDRLLTVPLFEERLVLVAPTQYPLRHSRLRMKDLAGLPLILMPADYCLRKMVEAGCSEARVKTDVVLEMTSPEGILQAVAEGAGLTILPELYVRLRSPGSKFRLIELYNPVPRHSVGLISLANRYQSLAVKEFARLCGTTTAQLMTKPNSSTPSRHPNRK